MIERIKKIDWMPFVISIVATAIICLIITVQEVCRRSAADELRASIVGAKVVEVSTNGTLTLILPSGKVLANVVTPK